MSDNQNEARRKFINLIKSMGLCQLIKTPTRFSATTNSILDVCVTNSDFIQKKEKKKKKSGVCILILVTIK